MRLSDLLIVGILLPVVLGQEQDPNDSMAQWIRTALENLRAKMPIGIPEIGMPVLEPLEIPTINEKIKEGIANVDLKFENLKISGLSKFNVRKVKFDLGTTELELGIFLPITNGEAKYDVNGKIASIIPLYGKGNAMVQLTDFDIKAKAKVILGAEIKLSTFEIELSFSNAQIFFENLLGGGNLGDLINTVINMFGKVIFDQHRKDVENLLNGAIRQAVNDELKKVKMSDLNIGYAAGPVLFKEANANNYIDQILQNLRPQIKSQDPLKLPYVRDGFEKKVGFIKFKGYAELRTGWLRGFTSLHRSGDVILGADPESGDIVVSANLGVTNLVVDYDCKVYFMGIKAYPALHADIERVNTFIKIRINVATGKRELVDFKITNIHKPKIKIRNVSVFGYLVSFIGNLAMTPIMNGVRGHLEGAIRNALKDAIRDVNIPLF